MPLAVQAATPPQIPKETIEAHDKAATYYMEKQITDPTHRWRGFIPTEDGLYYSGTGLGIAEVLGSAYLCPQSKYYKDKQVLSRIKLAMETVVREMTSDGNIWLPTTNFNSRTVALTLFWGATRKRIRCRKNSPPNICGRF